MTDTVIKGTGNSRTLRSVSNFLTLYPDYNSFARALINGTLPVDVGGLVSGGLTTNGTALNKANLLADATATALGLTSTATPNEAFNSIGSAIYAQNLALGGNVTASGSSSAALGYSANASGNTSTALGRSAKASSGASTALGSYANASGSASTALGHYAKASGENSTALGYYSNAAADNAVAIGPYANTSTANQIQIGNSTYCTSIKAVTNTIYSSDIRDKTDIEPVKDGAVEFLKRVKAIRYRENNREAYIDDEKITKEEVANLKYGVCGYDKEAHAKGAKKHQRMKIGVSAQETQEAIKAIFGDSSYVNLVYDTFYNFKDEEIPDGVESQLSINYTGFIPFLIKAVQELSDRLDRLEGAV